MPLHHKTKEAAVKKYRHLDTAALGAALKTDSNNYSDEEVQEIIQAIAVANATPETQGTNPQVASKPATENSPAAAVAVGATSPNAELADKLKAFNYGALTGESFKKYCLLVQSLPMEGKYDFELFQVETIRVQRYRGMKDSPIDTVGIRIKDYKPINRTRIAVKHAIATNGSVRPFIGADGEPEETGFELVASQLEHNQNQARFYLLKKIG